MPNWCDNIVTLRNSDKSKIDALATELSKDGNGEMLNTLRPNPAGEWDYNWSVENWGTKWDAAIIDWERRDDNEIWVSFESAWSPPTTLYEYLVEQGWEVDAVYYESGMGYGGVFTTEGGDDYYEYSLDDPESIEDLPEDVIELGDLRNRAEEYMVERMAEEWGDAERTDWMDMDVHPAHVGYYEVEFKGYTNPYIQFVKYDGENWDAWALDSLIRWRGLANDASGE
jgi:hypothetical protein